MKEIDVTLTDYFLCIESLVFALLIHKIPGQLKYKISYLILFLAFSTSAFLGGTYHGFIKNPFIWQATIVAIGISAYGFALSGLILIVKPPLIKMYKNIFIIIVLVYTLTTFSYPSFLLPIIISLPATMLTLLGFIKLYNKHKDPNLKLGIIGLYISLFAPIFQQFKISIHPVYFTYNAVYHVIIMISLYLFFRGATGAIGYLNNNLEH